MIYTLYEDNGRIYSSVTAYPTKDQTTIKGKKFIAGQYDCSEYYIADGQPIRIPEKPTDTKKFYKFNFDIKMWLPDAEETIKMVRRTRMKMLQLVDTVNPIRYSSLSEEQRQEITKFRQDLLDITDQEGYPYDVVFPVKPAWL
jgi:hypothetical protein